MMNEKGNIVMPVEAFDALETILKDPDADLDKSLSAFGYKWGESLVVELDESCEKEELPHFVKQLAWEAGISKLYLRLKDDEILVDILESRIENAHFIGGFISGLISELMSTSEESKRYGFKSVKEERDVTCLLSYIVKETKIKEEFEEKRESPIQHHDILKGETYLVIEDDPTEAKKSFDIFADFVTHGFIGMCMTTTIPSKIKETYGFESTDISWLTDYKTGTQEFRELNPNRLEFEISRDAKRFLKEEGQRILMIHGLEYLIRHNGFDKISDFLDTLSRIIYAKNNILLCPIYPKALKEIDYSNLKTILKVIGDQNG